MLIPLFSGVMPIRSGCVPVFSRNCHSLSAAAHTALSRTDINTKDVINRMKSVLIAFTVIGFSGIGLCDDHPVQIDESQQSENIVIARSGCCSYHDGVCGCDEASGMMRCCDGTLSPSCTCEDY